MSLSPDACLSHGVPAHDRAAPRRLCPRTRAPTRSRRSSSARWSSSSPRAPSGPLGAARVRARRPDRRSRLDRAASWRAWARWPASFAGATRCWPSRSPMSAARSAGCGSRAACSKAASSPRIQRVLVAARLMQADLRRVAETAPARRRAGAPAPGQGDRAAARAVGGPRRRRCSTPRARAWPPRGARCTRRASACCASSRRCSADSTRAPRRPTPRVTVRGGRYVIPVRRDSRSRPGGIIHDESGSAGTLFIEPSEAIELGNALREAEVDEERETLRVLRELTDLLRPELPLLRDAGGDVRGGGRSRRPRALRGGGRRRGARGGGGAGRAPVVVNGRHPLLLAGAEPVVPFDLELPAERAHAAHQRARTPAARPCCSRRSASRPRWPRAGSCRRSGRAAGCRSSGASTPTSATGRASRRACRPSARTSACCAGSSTRPTTRRWSCSTRSAAGPIRRKAPRSRRRRWCR